MIKTIKRLIAILLFFIIIIGSLAFLVTSNAGLQFSYQIIQKIIPGTLHIEKLQGCLLDTITIDNLSYQDQHGDNTVKHISFSWLPSKLLRGKIEIENFTIDDTVIRNKTNQQQLVAKHKIKFPLAIQIDHLIVTNLQIHKDKKSYVIQSIDLHGVITENYIALNKLKALTKDYQLNAQGKVAWQHLTDTNIQITASNITKKVPEFSMKLATNTVNKQLTVNGELQLGNNRVKINGSYRQQWALNWQITLEQLEDFIPNVHGKIISQGQLRGPLKSPVLIGQVTIADLRYQQEKIQQLSALFTINISDVLTHPQLSGDFTLKSVSSSIAKLGITLQLTDLRLHIT